MLNPPFRAAAAASVWTSTQGVASASVPCCDAPGHAAAPARARLADLDPHLHCSVIGTCLSTAELRKLMAHFIDVDGASDLHVHHEAVRLASASAEVSRALHKALDRRHGSELQRFAKAKDERAIAALWEHALRQGDVPGAYWAVLTHRQATSQARQRAFGDVHMLSHLVGSSNRADLQRLAALEQENAELRQRLDRQELKCVEVAGERDSALAGGQRLDQELAGVRAQLQRAQEVPSTQELPAASLAQLAAAVALQTQRRERAEADAQGAATEAERLYLEIEHLREQARGLSRELATTESHWRDSADGGYTPMQRSINGRRILYVGGRPSSTPAIRDLVLRHGGEFQRHDGGIEDRKGLLGAAIAWAQLVVFPVDCIDHDSALALKRACARQGIEYKALRTASVTSFVAAVAAPVDGGDAQAATSGLCIRHG